MQTILPSHSQPYRGVPPTLPFPDFDAEPDETNYIWYPGQPFSLKAPHIPGLPPRRNPGPSDSPPALTPSLSGTLIINIAAGLAIGLAALAAWSLMAGDRQ